MLSACGDSARIGSVVEATAAAPVSVQTLALSTDFVARAEYAYASLSQPTNHTLAAPQLTALHEVIRDTLVAMVDENLPQDATWVASPDPGRPGKTLIRVNRARWMGEAASGKDLLGEVGAQYLSLAGLADRRFVDGIGKSESDYRTMAPIYRYFAAIHDSEWHDTKLGVTPFNLKSEVLLAELTNWEPGSNHDLKHPRCLLHVAVLRDGTVLSERKTTEYELPKMVARLSPERLRILTSLIDEMPRGPLTQLVGTLPKNIDQLYAFRVYPDGENPLDIAQGQNDARLTMTGDPGSPIEAVLLGLLDITILRPESISGNLYE